MCVHYGFLYKLNAIDINDMQANNLETTKCYGMCNVCAIQCISIVCFLSAYGCPEKTHCEVVYRCVDS